MRSQRASTGLPAPFTLAERRRIGDSMTVLDRAARRKSTGRFRRNHEICLYKPGAMRQARTTSILGSAFGHSCPGVPETEKIGAYPRAFGRTAAPGAVHKSPASRPIPAALLQSTRAPYKQEVTGSSPVPPIARGDAGLARPHAWRGSSSTPVSRSETCHRRSTARSIPSRRRIGLRTGGPLLTNRGP